MIQSTADTSEGLLHIRKRKQRETGTGGGRQERNEGNREEGRKAKRESIETYLSEKD